MADSGTMTMGNANFLLVKGRTHSLMVKGRNT